MNVDVLFCNQALWTNGSEHTETHRGCYFAFAAPEGFMDVSLQDKHSWTRGIGFDISKNIWVFSIKVEARLQIQLVAASSTRLQGWEVGHLLKNSPLGFGMDPHHFR